MSDLFKKIICAQEALQASVAALQEALDELDTERKRLHRAADEARTAYFADVDTKRARLDAKRDDLRIEIESLDAEARGLAKELARAAALGDADAEAAARARITSAATEKQAVADLLAAVADAQVPGDPDLFAAAEAARAALDALLGDQRTVAQGLIEQARELQRFADKFHTWATFHPSGLWRPLKVSNHFNGVPDDD